MMTFIYNSPNFTRIGIRLRTLNAEKYAVINIPDGGYRHLGFRQTGAIY